MSARPSSVAVLQLRAHDRAAFAERWPQIRARIAAAADDGAELIVVPEGTVPAYVIGTEAVAPQLLDAAAQDVIGIAAGSGATVVYGSARHDGARFANAAYVVTPDGIAGFADKCFLWHFDRRWFSPGDALQPVSTPFGRLGVLVCADGRIPTIASTLVDRGAEMIVMPTAWVTSGRDPAQLENLQADVMIDVRARENGVPMVCANKVGVEARSVAYCGKSTVLDAAGRRIARASETDETTLLAAVDLGPPRRPRVAPPAAAERGTGAPLPAAARIALAAAGDDALRELAATADADVLIEPAAPAESRDVARVSDDAMLDPRALVRPRLDGVRLFVWAAGIDPEWIVPFARTRAAELRAYVVVFERRGGRAFAVDPDGAVLCGTFGAYELAAFAFDRRRTDAWMVAPYTDVRAGLERAEALRA